MSLVGEVQGSECKGEQETQLLLWQPIVLPTT